ncbi:mitochondrial ribosomal protein L53 [Ptiloglossa arizonensis]|uniref:mitochondrial ribosomal protein L53 n=1 Tax=Ptiloglossa arizonensis TaxID=3350558 RepID=UPI003F9FED62
MSLPFNGVRTRSKGLISAIAKQLRLLTLKPVKSINIKFDPFDTGASEIRSFFFHITTPKIYATNPFCVVKPQFTSDLSEPLVTFNLVSGDNVIFKSRNLTSLNILQLYNKHITPMAPAESEIEEKVAKKKKKKGSRVKIKPGSKRRGVFL